MMNRQTHVAVWIRMLAIGEVRLSRVMGSFFRQQAAAASRAYRNFGEYEAQTAIHEGLNKLYRILVAHYTAMTQELISYTAEQLASLKKATFQERVQSFIAKEALQKALIINKTTLQLVRDAISEGEAQGLGESGTAKLIQAKVGEEFGDRRARTISRTETHNAAAYGMQAAAEETQLPLIREWVAVEDERTRDEHAEADGQQRGMNEPFEVGGELIDRPGEGSPENAINCRCTIIYIPQDGERGGRDFEE